MLEKRRARTLQRVIFSWITVVVTRYLLAHCLQCVADESAWISGSEKEEDRIQKET